MTCKVTFHALNSVDDSLLKFAVIAAYDQGRWLYCQHRQRTTWELPGGHREVGEPILNTARRELYEETGALAYDLTPLCIYGVTAQGTTSYGLLAFADIHTLGALPESEIKTVQAYTIPPAEQTYPQIQPYLFFKAKQFRYPCTHLIWDWNGTLLDDVAVAVQSVNDLLQQAEKEPTTTARYREMVETPIIRYYEKLFDLQQISFETLTQGFLSGYNKYIETATLMEGAQQILRLFHEQGKHQLIVSSFEQTRLLHFVERFGVFGYFEAILGADNIRAESKVGRAQEWAARQGRTAPRFVVIGDLVHDYEMAKAIHADCILIAQGHQSKADLLSCGVPVLDDLRELPAYLSGKLNEISSL